MQRDWSLNYNKDRIYEYIVLNKAYFTLHISARAEVPDWLRFFIF